MKEAAHDFILTPSPLSMSDYDFFILGGGSAGYNAASAGCDLGLRVGLAEGGEELGGLCILRGCMPSKTLLESANRHLTLRRAGEFGLSAGAIGFSGPEMIARKGRLVGEFAGYRAKQLQSGRFDLFRGWAAFVDPHTVEIRLADGGTRRVTSETFLLATGSHLKVVPLPGLQETGFWTSDDVLAAAYIPKSVVILGGGAVAVEYAHYYSALGTEVTIVQRSGQLVKEMDGDVAEALAGAYRKRGMRLWCHTRLLRAEAAPNGMKRVVFEAGGGTESAEAEQIVYALGRQPRTEGLALDRAGLELTRERLAVQSTQQTAAPHIFAAGDVAGGIEDVKENRSEDIDLDQLRDQGEQGPVVKIVNLILVQALKEKASDIHIEPFEKTIKLRYRVDGNLVEASSPPKSIQLPMASRIKILAGLDIAERRLPQDGRFRIRVSGKEIDLRVSMLPTVHGEKIVIRILDKSALSGSVSMLGLDETTLGIFKKAIDAPHGMLLVTGPTGSGKTTTLYSVLHELNSPEYNIVTVEDPVEYQLPGVNQVAVRTEMGLTFAGALRSILRQDPDIVMIGEIRDQETADIAVKAALTGHQVLSTLHTNDAAGAISRLDDMGIEPFLISSSVILTCAQRLVRRICPNCKEEFVPEPELFQKLDVPEMVGETFFRGAGCDRCKGRGYSGRAAVMEVLPISENIRRLIIKRASASVIKNQGVQEGMKTLRHAGIDKAREGVTTLEEVLRTTSEDH